jgi:hypothetical protein
MRKIGNLASRFEGLFDRLPPRWTTIRRLASLEREDFDRVAPQLSKATTAADIDRIVPRDKRGKRPTKSFIRLDLTESDTVVKLKVARLITSLGEEHKFGVERSDDIAVLSGNETKTDFASNNAETDSASNTAEGA